MRAASITIEPLQPEHAPTCVAIMRALPAWFGVEDAIVKYGKDLESGDGFVAVDGSTIAGFVGLKRYGAQAVEINIIALHPSYRRRGIGSRLVLAAEAEAHSAGAKFLHTKTVSPARHDAAYDESRAFWAATGFVPLDEHLLWGAQNPCLVLVKAL